MEGTVLTLRRVNQNDNSENRLSDWKLVAAVALISTVIIVALWLTGSEKAAIITTIPLLLTLGVISIRRD
jgi:hypothetical protein